MMLSQKIPGSSVMFGAHEFLVLGHFDNGTAVITKRFPKRMQFGESADYETSNVRQYCNGEFLDALAGAVGEENIMPHYIPLTADDGTNAAQFVTDKVSILTTDRYRFYREYLPRTGTVWWLANRISMEREYSRGVCCVFDFGTVCWDYCDYDCGVRPFCILESSILVPDELPF